MAQKTFMDNILMSVQSLFFKGKPEKAITLAELFKASRKKTPAEIIPIKNRREFSKMRDQWNKDELKKFPKKKQEEFADYLVKKSKIMKLKPSSYWLKVAKNV